jgi:hypothetical protein
VTVIAVLSKHPQVANSRCSIYGASPTPRKFKNHEFILPSAQSDITSLKFMLAKIKKALYFPEIVTVLGIKIIQFWNCDDH